MENKVIIDLDEYLELRSTVDNIKEKIKRFKETVQLKRDSGNIYNPAYMFNEPYILREMVVKEEDLTDFINDILDESGYDLKIIKKEK